VTAFRAIQEGCDKFCSFCVVPYTRGAEQSRPASAVLAEARRLTAQGAREITLLGQNVNAWHGDGLDGRTWTLARLLRALAEIPGIGRLRYATSHPRDMDQALVEALSNPQAQPKAGQIDDIRRQISDTERKLSAVSAQLQKEFPDYAALSSPKPLKVETMSEMETARRLAFLLAAGRNAT